MSNDILLRLSRADAGLLSELAEYGLVAAEDIYDYADGRRVINLLDAALAEGPERAATGEAITDEMVTRCAIALMDSGVYECGIDGARDAARTVLAAIGGGGEGES